MKLNTRRADAEGYWDRSSQSDACLREKTAKCPTTRSTESRQRVFKAMRIERLR